MTKTYRVSHDFRDDFYIEFTIDREHDDIKGEKFKALMKEVYGFYNSDVDSVFEGPEKEWLEATLKHTAANVFHNCSFADGWNNTAIAIDEMEQIDGFPLFGEGQAIRITRVYFEGIDSVSLEVSEVKE